MLSVFMLSVFMLSVFMLSVFMLNVIMLSVTTHGAVALRLCPWYLVILGPLLMIQAHLNQNIPYCVNFSLIEQN